MYRHGDVFVAKDKIPKSAKQLPHCILAEGADTGHRHEIREANAAQLFSSRGNMFLRVTAKKATLIHDQHKPISLPKGDYKVWFQREFEPKALNYYRRVVD